MAGEIRAAMAGLRAAREGMVSSFLDEIKTIEADISATHTDGLEALKLPRAELEATKQEIAEIKAEFADLGNEKGNLNPLPPPKGSAAPSAAPAAQPSPVSVQTSAPDATAEKKT